MVRRLAALAFLLVVGGAALYLTHPFGDSGRAQSRQQPQGKSDRAQPVFAAEAVAKPMPVQLTTIGRVQTIANVTVRSRIDGVIASVEVQDGQEVKTGDVLLTFDDRQAQALVHQAEGALARDRAQLDNARRDLARLEPLAEKSFASKQQLDQARATVAADLATVQADQAQLENYQVQLTYTVVRAPIDGRIGTISFKVGNSIKANDTTALLTLNQIRPIYVAFAVPQGSLGELQDAMGAGPLVATAAIPGSDEVQQGRVAYIENAVDAATNTIGAKATFANERSRLWPGQFVNVAVTLRIEPQALVVPAEAVQTGQQGTYVFVIKPDGTAEMRPVDVRRTIEGEAAIAKGLAAGERVVTEGQLRLEPGTKVEVKAPQGTAPRSQEKTS
jgi:multidrug efflux system membrane fusion protein